MYAYSKNTQIPLLCGEKWSFEFKSWANSEWTTEACLSAQLS